MKEYLQAIDAVLAAHGIDEWQLDPRGKHPRVRFKINGTSRMFVLGRTPSDHRGALNCRSTLKNMLRRAGIVEKPANKSKKRDKTRKNSQKYA